MSKSNNLANKQLLAEAYALIGAPDPGRSVIVTDPNREDNPIIFTSAAFTELTGYSQDEIRGRNCRFLQGPDTDQETRTKIRKAIEAGEAIEVDILNYKKNGEPFWQRLKIKPLMGLSGKLRCFIGIQTPLSPAEIAEKTIETID